MSAPTNESIYQQLGVLITTRPPLEGPGDYGQEQFQWLGRVGVLVEQVGGTMDIATTNVALGNMVSPSTRSRGLGQVMLILHKLLARAELSAPPEAQGAFIDVGQSFTALQAVSKVLTTAQSDVLIVDPYWSLSAMFDFLHAVPNGVSIRLLCDSQFQNLNTEVRTGVQRWQQEYVGKPLEARATAPRALHDRLIIVDQATAWNLSQSLKDMANRSPASLTRSDAEAAALKIPAYASLWVAATTL